MASTTDEYRARPVKENLRALHTDAARGLSAADVGQRLEQYGYNEIDEK